MTNLKNDDIFTILYEINGQKYIIGITNEHIPQIATIGVNTPRPLPINIQNTLIETIKDIKLLTESPKITDYNAPSKKMSKTLLENLSMPINPELNTENIAEIIAFLKSKMFASNYGNITNRNNTMK